MGSLYCAAGRIAEAVCTVHSAESGAVCTVLSAELQGRSVLCCRPNQGQSVLCCRLLWMTVRDGLLADQWGMQAVTAGA